MLTSQQWQEKIIAMQTEVIALAELATTEKRELTAEEFARIDALNGTGDKTGEIQSAIEQRDRQIKIEARIANAITIQQPIADHVRVIGTDGDDLMQRISVPHSQRNRHDKRFFATDREAFVAGHFFLAACHGNQKSRKWCQDHGVMMIQTEGENTKGGFAVPEILEPTIIRIVEEFGVFRRNGFVYPMGSDSVLVPRRTSGYTVYYAGEGTAVTTPLVSLSDVTLSQVRLTARKPMVITAISKEFSEDEVIGFGNLMALEMALAFANAEDQAGFNGDGTSNFGGIKGLKNELLAGSIADAASGNVSFATLDLADFHKAQAMLPAFQGIQPRWYISSQGFYSSMVPLQIAAGGNTVADIASGGKPMFLGVPVEMTQVLPTTLASQVSTIVAYYGDLRMCSTMGVRRGMAVETDDSIYFLQQLRAVMGYERYDINVHEVGTATTAGPMIALKTAAS